MRSTFCITGCDVSRAVRQSWLGAWWHGLIALCLASAASVLGQTHVASWTATAQGGLAPTGLALATEGGTQYLYACDQAGGRILKFNTSTGAVAAVLGGPGSGNGQFSQPYGIAVHSPSGDLYVAERGNNRIQRITNIGTHVVAWGTGGTGAGQFGEPIGVAVDSGGNVYVTENANHRVQKFQVAQTGGVWTATPVATWGSSGSGNGQFNRPYGIAVDAAGNVWVADGFNGRVQKFNSAGVFQSVLGAAGTAAGQFVVATWVGVGPTGDLFVSSTNSNPQDGTLPDAASQCVSRFTSAGTFVSRWGGGWGTAAGQFKLPFAAVIDASSRAYVADFYNNRVQVFDLATPPGGGTGPDTTAPAVANFQVGGSTATSVTFALTFTEPVTGVDATDFAVVSAGGAAATVGTVTGIGAAYTIPVTLTGATGTVQLNLKATGTGIADTAGNAIATGATGPVFTIGSTPGGGGTSIVSVTPPPNGTYDKGDDLTFTVRFSGNVTLISARAIDRRRGGDDDDDDDVSAYFTWTAAGSSDPRRDSGKVTYRSGNGTNTLTFRYKVKNDDYAPNGIAVGTSLQLEGGTIIRDSSGAALTAQQLTLPWATNPLAGVKLDARKSNPGKGKGPDRIVNLSSRLRVTGGDASRTVVAGFVVTGSAPKSVLIRAIGPGLASFGVRDTVAQPRLVLRDSTGRIVGEDEAGGDRAEIAQVCDRVGAFRGHSRDAALLVSLAPGAYTAQVTANGNGLVLVEVYDASTGTAIETEHIVNISTRGFVGAGDDVLVAGFVVVGSTPRQVLIRGIGPALGTFGVTGTLADPVLKLFRAGSSAPVAQNDDWQTPVTVTGGAASATAADVTAAATAAGAFPLGTSSKDAAIVVTLAPGNYSAVVSGANNSTGAGLVEVYELP